MGCRLGRRISCVFSDVFNPGYIFVNIGVDADISSHEMSDFNPLELFFADDSSDSHFLPDIVQREGERKKWSDLLTGALQSPSGKSPD